MPANFCLADPNGTAFFPMLSFCRSLSIVQPPSLRLLSPFKTDVFYFTTQQSFATIRYHCEQRSTHHDSPVVQNSRECRGRRRDWACSSMSTFLAHRDIVLYSVCHPPSSPPPPSVSETTYPRASPTPSPTTSPPCVRILGVEEAVLDMAHTCPFHSISELTLTAGVGIECVLPCGGASRVFQSTCARGKKPRSRQTGQQC